MKIKPNFKHSFALISIASLAACAPAMHPEIQKSENALASLTATTNAETLASREIQEAEDAVNRARMDWKENKDEAEALHLSYLAGRRIEIAQVKLAEQQAELSAKELANRREAVVENAREAQAIQAEAAAVNLGLEAERLRRETESRVTEIARLKSELANLKAQSTDRGLQLTLGDVLFESERATLKPGAERSLKPLAVFLRDHPSRVVEIEGHTDNQGSDEYNKTLSQRRAEAVKNLLVSLDVAENRISARGMGEDFPRAENDSAAGRLENRRVELFVKNNS